MLHTYLWFCKMDYVGRWCFLICVLPYIRFFFTPVHCICGESLPIIRSIKVVHIHVKRLLLKKKKKNESRISCVHSCVLTSSFLLCACCPSVIDSVATVWWQSDYVSVTSAQRLCWNCSVTMWQLFGYRAETLVIGQLFSDNVSTVQWLWQIFNSMSCCGKCSLTM